MRKQVTYLGNILCYEIENLNKPVCICFHGMNMTRSTATFIKKLFFGFS